MYGEEVILRALIDGEQPKDKIPLAGNALTDAGRQLEERGLLKRGGLWRLTKDGIMYAINSGISPKPYNILDALPPVNDADIPNFHSFTPNVQKARVKWWWFAVAIVVLAPLAYFAGYYL